MVEIHNPEDVDDPSFDEGEPQSFMYIDDHGNEGGVYEVQKEGSEYVATDFGGDTEVDSVNVYNLDEADSDIALDEALQELTANPENKSMAEALNR